jgi:hypothetical protein
VTLMIACDGARAFCPLEGNQSARYSAGNYVTTDSAKQLPEAVESAVFATGE